MRYKCLDCDSIFSCSGFKKTGKFITKTRLIRLESDKVSFCPFCGGVSSKKISDKVNKLSNLNLDRKKTNSLANTCKLSIEIEK